MAKFETNLLDENGLFHRTPLSEEVSDEITAFAKKITDISKRENLSLMEINILETHVHSLVGLEFAEHRLRKGMEKYRSTRETLTEHFKKDSGPLEPSPGGGFQLR